MVICSIKPRPFFPPPPPPVPFLTGDRPPMPLRFRDFRHPAPVPPMFDRRYPADARRSPPPFDAWIPPPASRSPVGMYFPRERDQPSPIRGASSVSLKNRNTPPTFERDRPPSPLRGDVNRDLSNVNKFQSQPSTNRGAVTCCVVQYNTATIFVIATLKHCCL